RNSGGRHREPNSIGVLAWSDLVVEHEGAKAVLLLHTDGVKPRSAGEIGGGGPAGVAADRRACDRLERQVVDAAAGTGGALGVTDERVDREGCGGGAVEIDAPHGDGG